MYTETSKSGNVVIGNVLIRKNAFMDRRIPDCNILITHIVVSIKVILKNC